MRLWSLQPSQLDVKGLLAVWREGLLAQEVLRGKTRGYRNHPQLDRFKEGRDPISLIGAYLSEVHREALRRGYAFDRKRIIRYAVRVRARIGVARGQVRHEWDHLLQKLRKRDPKRYWIYKNNNPQVHPLFRKVKGGVASWERLK